MGLYDHTHSPDYALGNLHAATSSAMAAQKIAQRDYDQAQAEADKWERRYQLALKENREDLAHHAQFQKERHKAIAGRLKSLVAQQAPQVDTDNEVPENILNEAIQQTQEAVKSAFTTQKSLQLQYDKVGEEAKSWHQKVQIALQNEDEKLAFNALIAKTIQSKVATTIKTQLEQQQATVKLLKTNLTALKNVKLMLEVEPELAEMKTQIINTPTPNKNCLSVAAPPSEQVVDAKLEDLRSQLDQL